MVTKLKKKKGQSTLEYIILVTAVIVIIIGLVFNSNSPFKKTLNTTYEGAIEKLDDVGAAWKHSINSGT